jgi:hypothetical protein
VAMGHWDAGEYNNEACGGARLVEESRFGFEKLDLQTQASPGMRRAALDGGGLAGTRRWRLSAGKEEGQSSLFGQKQQKIEQKTPKMGAKMEKRKEGRRREKKSVPPPLKSLTSRWESHKIINISGMHAAHYLHFMYTIIIFTMPGFCE